MEPHPPHTQEGANTPSWSGSAASTSSGASTGTFVLWPIDLAEDRNEEVLRHMELNARYIKCNALGNLGVIVLDALRSGRLLASNRECHVAPLTTNCFGNPLHPITPEP